VNVSVKEIVGNGKEETWNP